MAQATNPCQELPVSYREVLNLGMLGVSRDYIKSPMTSMESDKFVCVSGKLDGQPSIMIVDLAAGNSVQRRPIYAEAAIINPSSNVIALRAENQLQLFNMERRTKIKSHSMSEAVVFWHWISVDVMAIVTASAVFHWNIEDDSLPTKVFYRSASLGAETQIVSYEASIDNKWMLLVGTSQAKGGHIVGNIQLYSMEKKVSQVLQGHAGAFAQMKPSGRKEDVQVLFVAGSKGVGQPVQLFCMELGRDHDAPGGVFHLPPQRIAFAPDEQDDFPVSMLVSPGDDIVYMITNLGYLFVFDAHSGKLVYRAHFTQDAPFVTCFESKSKGMLCITHRGQLLHFAINRAKLVPYVLNTMRDQQLALALASRMDLPGADSLYSTEFNRLIRINDVQGAARLAAASPQGLLRTPQTTEIFKQMAAQLDQPQPILQYFSVLLEKSPLNKEEAIELVRSVLLQGRGELLQTWLLEDKLECSVELGDLVAQSDAMMALSVYLRAGAMEKVVECFVQNVLRDTKVQNPHMLVHLCDRYDVVEELVQYLYSSNSMESINIYATKVSPDKAPVVIGKLLDLGCDEGFIKTLLKQVTQCSVDDLCEQVEKRNRLDLLQPWLESRIARGNTEAATHSALGKVYITLDKNPQQFLIKNKFYDSKVVGKFCEKVDPYLAYLAYRRASSECDDDLIRVATENGLFKDLARYLVERQDLDLWGKVLMRQEEGEAGDPNRRALIDQVVQTALPESTKPGEVSTTVHAFMNAELSNELGDQKISCVGMSRCFAFF
ncbi:hypothetical protein PRNP1_012681 [Phytophthora ramorum]